MATQYKHENVDFTFNRSNRKWTFQLGNYTLVQACNGRENAEKVAAQVNASFKRNGQHLELDGLARKAISKLTN